VVGRLAFCGRVQETVLAVAGGVGLERLGIEWEAVLGSSGGLGPSSGGAGLVWRWQGVVWGRGACVTRQIGRFSGGLPSYAPGACTVRQGSRNLVDLSNCARPSTQPGARHSSASHATSLPSAVSDAKRQRERCRTERHSKQRTTTSEQPQRLTAPSATRHSPPATAPRNPTRTASRWSASACRRADQSSSAPRSSGRRA
jgi:hypothetical protein